jgi:hypothetical protein
MARAARFANRTFDARPDRLDLRDLPYRPPLRSLAPAFPGDTAIAEYLASYVRAGLILDQGTEGACTGFGLACVVNYLFWVRRRNLGEKDDFARVSPRMLYELAKRYDEWKGEDYEGSSCRGALKGWHKHGVCAETLWPYPLDAKGKPVFERPADGWETDAATRPLGVYYRIDKASVVDVQAAIADIGAVYASGGAHDGWDKLMRDEAAGPPKSHADLRVIAAPKSAERGGHSFALVGYDERGFIVQNSWGTTWGASGFGILPYDDWVENATDAWACALGVAVALPEKAGRMRPVATSRFRVGAGRSLTTVGRTARDPANPPDDPWPVDRAYDFAGYRPWSTSDAYSSTLVTGNDGVLVVSDFTRATDDAEGHAHEIVVDVPLAFARKAGGRKLKLALYAHGGLNSEEESIRRIRVLAPCFAANGIHPLFLTWKTGVGETLGSIVEDCAGRILGTADVEKAAGILDALGDAKDRAVEALAHVLAKGLWTEMRENAELGKLPGHGLEVLARKLGSLAAALDDDGRSLELHFVGHSAGAILLGHLLEKMTSLRVRTCTLLAPACSVSFATRFYLPAADAGLIDLDRLWIHYLSDANEKRDAVPSPELPAYGRSLLYLVSRALDDVRKMPILGLSRALDAAYARDDEQWAKDELVHLREWQSRWDVARRSIEVAALDVPTTNTGGRTQATHGSFDNNLDAVTDILARIRGSRLVSPLEWLDFD